MRRSLKKKTECVISSNDVGETATETDTIAGSRRTKFKSGSLHFQCTEERSGGRLGTWEETCKKDYSSYKMNYKGAGRAGATAMGRWVDSGEVAAGGGEVGG